jgi:hypothetical protein
MSHYVLKMDDGSSVIMGPDSHSGQFELGGQTYGYFTDPVGWWRIARVDHVAALKQFVARRQFAPKPGYEIQLEEDCGFDNWAISPEGDGQFLGQGCCIRIV